MTHDQGRKFQNVAEGAIGRGITVVRPAAKNGLFKGLVEGVVAFVGIVLAIPVLVVFFILIVVWPLIKFTVWVDVTFQFFRMLYYWNTPGVHATLTFLLHFGATVAVALFFILYEPKFLNSK